MEDRIYSATYFWQGLGALNEFTGWFMPFFLFAASLSWVLKERTVFSNLSLIGGILAVSARVTHWLVPSVSSIALGYSEPAVEQNPLIWFLYIQALNIGSFLFIVCILLSFIFLRTGKSRE